MGNLLLQYLQLPLLFETVPEWGGTRVVEWNNYLFITEIEEVLFGHRERAGMPASWNFGVKGNRMIKYCTSIFDLGWCLGGVGLIKLTCYELTITVRNLFNIIWLTETSYKTMLMVLSSCVQSCIQYGHINGNNNYAYGSCLSAIGY